MIFLPRRASRLASRRASRRASRLVASPRASSKSSVILPDARGKENKHGLAAVLPKDTRWGTRGALSRALRPVGRSRLSALRLGPLGLPRCTGSRAGARWFGWRLLERYFFTPRRFRAACFAPLRFKIPVHRSRLLSSLSFGSRKGNSKNKCGGIGI